MQQSFHQASISSLLHPFYITNQQFTARFQHQYQIQDPYVRLYQICNDLNLKKRVAIRNYQAVDQQQENDIIQNMESYVLLGDIEGMCKLVAFCKKQQTQTISAAFEYDDYSLQEGLKNRRFMQNRNKLYMLILVELITIISDAKEKGIVIQELIPSSILISSYSGDVNKLKVLYDERQKKYDKIQEGIKVLASAEKILNGIIQRQYGNQGYEQSVFALGLLLIDLMFQYQSISALQADKDGVLKKDIPLSRLNIQHKSYLIFQDNNKVTLNSYLINQKLIYLRQINNPFINQLVTLSQLMIANLSARIEWQDLKLKIEKLVFETKAKIEQPLGYRTPHKVQEEVNQQKFSYKSIDKAKAINNIVSQTTVATAVITSNTDYKTNDQQSLQNHSNRQPLSLDTIVLKVNTNKQMKDKFNQFMSQLKINMSKVIKKQYLDGSFYYGQLNLNGKRQGNGVFVCSNGDIYFGRWAQNALIEGNYIFKNGQSFEGLVKNGKQGYGKYNYINGNIYEGQFQNDVKSGYGKMKYPNGDVYQGLWARGKKNGDGKYYYNNGTLYQGNFIDGKKSGFGVITFPQKTKIQAYWNKTHIQGQGKVFYSNGNYFYGNYYLSQKSGQGMYIWEDTKYEGEFSKDSMQGTATIRYSETQYYEGSIKNGKRDGRGFYKYSNGDEFRGDWKNDQKLYGHYKFHQGRQFEGRFKGNEVNFGVMRYECGESYQGEFKDGVRDGQGIYRDDRGQILLQGRWKNDQFIHRI